MRGDGLLAGRHAENSRKGNARLNTSFIAESQKASSNGPKRRSPMPINRINRLGMVTLQAKHQVSQDITYAFTQG